jgi:pyrroline-5-carboxylate reductase
MKTQKIGIIGSGDVGKALAIGFLNNGCIPGFISNSWTHAFKLLKLKA